MSLLTRYLIRQNSFLLFSVLFLGVGLYLLTDIFERIDDFIEAGLGFGMTLGYFAVKIPMIISQILPAVFLLAGIVQFSIMSRNRELVALNAGGISPLVIARYILLWGFVWAGMQFAFSQYIGVQGDRLATRIWREDVKGKEFGNEQLKGIWFTEGRYVVHMAEVFPAKGTGTGFLAYRLSDDNRNIDQVIEARGFKVEKGVWRLKDATITNTEEFAAKSLLQMELHLKQNLSAFLVANSNIALSQHNFWELGSAITRLSHSGSNVESLRTAWHGKLAYSGSLVVMGLLALCITLANSNIYISVGKGLVWIFVLYVASSLSNSLGSNGRLPPVAAAWLPNSALALFCMMRLFRIFKRRI